MKNIIVVSLLLALAFVAMPARAQTASDAQFNDDRISLGFPGWHRFSMPGADPTAILIVMLGTQPDIHCRVDRDEVPPAPRMTQAALNARLANTQQVLTRISSLVSGGHVDSANTQIVDGVAVIVVALHAERSDQPAYSVERYFAIVKPDTSAVQYLIQCYGTANTTDGQRAAIQTMLNSLHFSSADGKHP